MKNAEKCASTSQNLVEKPIKKAFFAFLVPSLFATMTTSIYVLADTIMIGQFEGDAGLLALNICLPLYSLVMGLGVLFGVGGGVLYSVCLGRNDKAGSEKAFTCAMIGALAATLLIMLLTNIFFDPLMRLLGADDTSIILVAKYAKFVTLGAPVFVFAMALQALVRNDSNPRLTMIAVITGGALNVILDYILVFPCKLGMVGAAAATVISYGVNVIILCTHFFSKRCGLRFNFHIKFLGIFAVVMAGLAAFVAEFSAGIVTFVFNRQLLLYIGSFGVVVYGVISNVSVVALSLFNGAAQACQPIISANYGANRPDRIKKVMGMGLVTACSLGVLITLVGEISPIFLLNLFTSSPSSQVVSMVNFAVRVYFCTALVMAINIFFTGYFQATMHPRTAFALSLLRGLVLSIALVMLLPLIFGGSIIWFVMPIAEVVTLMVVFIAFKASNKRVRNVQLS